MGGVANGWQISVVKEGGSEAAFSNQPWMECGSTVKLEASSRAFKKTSVFSITSSERGVKKDSMPSNFSMEEIAGSSPAVAFDDEGSHSLPLRFSGSEAALLAVEEAEMNGSSPSLTLVWLPSDIGESGPGSLCGLKGTTSPKFRPLRSMSQFSNRPKSYQINS